MKHVVSLGFGKITSEIEIDKDCVKSFLEGYEINKEFFKKHPKNVKIIISKDEKDFKKRVGKKYQSWITGIALPGKIIIKKEEIVKDNKKKYYSNFAIHELNHVFWHHNYKTWKPKWLMEGFACYVAKDYNYSKKELQEFTKEFKLKQKMMIYQWSKEKSNRNKPRYPFWANLVRFLIDKFGIKKVNSFFEEYSKYAIKENYKHLFEKHFRATENQIFREFLSSTLTQEKLFRY